MGKYVERLEDVLMDLIYLLVIGLCYGILAGLLILTNDQKKKPNDEDFGGS